VVVREEPAAPEDSRTRVKAELQTASSTFTHQIKVEGVLHLRIPGIREILVTGIG
jgi:hypothetical protein